MASSMSGMLSYLILLNPLPDDKILDWSKLKQISEDILKCIQNEKQVPYRVKNIVRKGELACYKQFPLFSQCVTDDHSFKHGCFPI